MSESLYPKSGGNGKSSIIVTAPPGSTVTCVMGEVVKTPREANGTWIFKNCGIGEWTVTAVNGSSEATSVVQIQEEEQLFRYYVVLSFFAATINVTYPAGSICTCTKGETVLSAPDTSGAATFTVPEPGEWTVASRDAEEDREKSENVVITEDGQSISVTIIYSFYIFNASPINNDITGGWHSVGKMKFSGSSQEAREPDVTTHTGYITIYESRAGAGIYKTINKIDLTDVQTIGFTGTLRTNKSTEKAERCTLNCWSSIGSYFDSNVAARMLQTVSNGVKGTYYLDVSALSGSYFIGFGVHNTESYVDLYSLELVY